MLLCTLGKLGLKAFSYGFVVTVHGIGHQTGPSYKTNSANLKMCATIIKTDEHTINVLVSATCECT
jgi:hypothetical protein